MMLAYQPTASRARARRPALAMAVVVTLTFNIGRSGGFFTQSAFAEGTGYAFTTLAGQAMPGGTDGAANTASFAFPTGVAVNQDGTIFVADSHNHTIRRISRTGVVTTLAGAAGQPGSVDGSGSSARFNFPYGVAVDEAENIYVTDEENFTIRKISPVGVVSTLAGRAGEPGDSDGPGRDARFNGSAGIAVDHAGNVFIADSLGRTIRTITPAGIVSTIAGQSGISGTRDGAGGEALFGFPGGVAVDRDGTIFVTDNQTTIRRVTPAGMTTTLAGNRGRLGHVDGVGSEAQFILTGGIAVDRLGIIYAADAHNTIRRITPDGVVTTLAGEAGTVGSTDGNASSTRFHFPGGVATDVAGNIYVSDSGNNTIRKGVSTTRLVNLSVRCLVGTGDETPIVGLVASGSGARASLLRAIGPTLATFGVPGATPDPALMLLDFTGREIQGNDNWGGAAELGELFDLLGAFPIALGSKDAALFAVLSSGLYSAHITTNDETAGVVLMEVYDADLTTRSRLVNLSARAYAGAAEETLIAGFVLVGSAPKTLLIRVAGPSLAMFGLATSSLLVDPTLTIYRGSTRIAANDDWGATTELKATTRNLGAFVFDSETGKDAALVATLEPGEYTAHVAGAHGGSGVALVEVYEVP